MNLSNKHEKYFRGLVCNNERANFCVITCVFDKKTAAVPSRGPLAAPGYTLANHTAPVAGSAACMCTTYRGFVPRKFDDCGERKYVQLIGLETGYNKIFN